MLKAIEASGKNEEEAKQISYRLHGEQGTTTVGFDEFVTLVTSEISSKAR